MHPRYRKRLQEICTEKDLSYDAVVSHKRGRLLAYHRRHIILQMSEEFENLSTLKLGELFNKDHSSIVNARQKALHERTEGVTPWLHSALSTPRSISSSSAKLIPYQGR